MRQHRGWNYATNLENPEWKDRRPPNDYRNQPRHGSQPTRRQRENSERSNNPLERRQQPWNQHWKSHNVDPGGPNQPQKDPHGVEQAFGVKSKQLKEYLVRSLDAALGQIEQDYPEASGDEMDWQYEEEIVITQTPEDAYTWAVEEWASPRIAGENVPRRSSNLLGLGAAGRSDGKQREPPVHYTKGFLREERKSNPWLASSIDQDSGIV